MAIFTWIFVQLMHGKSENKQKRQETTNFFKKTRPWWPYCGHRIWYYSIQLTKFVSHSVTRFGEILPLRQKFEGLWQLERVYFVFSKILHLLSQIYFDIGLILIVVNCQGLEQGPRSGVLRVWTFFQILKMRIWNLYFEYLIHSNKRSYPDCG